MKGGEVMIDYIKSKLLEEPEKIRELLEKFDYHHISIKPSYLSFGRSQDSSAKSITLYLKDNPNIIVKDWAINQAKDIFNYIVSNRSVSFKEVITVAKNILGIEGYVYQESTSRSVFGGFYSNIKNRSKQELQIYDESILDKYDNCGNERFLRDGISLEAQKYFGVGYDIESQSITIPIYDEIGNLVGVKCRRNCDVGEGEQKYWYDVPCQMSSCLYGYCQNYEYLEGADVIYVVEAEKGCMQAFSYGYKNFVALGSGSISRKQVQLLLQLNPKRIVLLHDFGYCEDSVFRNLKMIQGYSRMKQVELGYWDYFNKDYPNKVSATDMGSNELARILNEEIKYIKEGAKNDNG